MGEDVLPERTGWTGRALVGPVGGTAVENAASEDEVSIRRIIDDIR